MTSAATGKMPTMAIYGGIDLGGTKIQAAVVDEGSDHAVLGAKRDQTPLKGGPKAIAGRMAAVLKEALEEAGLGVSDLAGVGVGSPGSVDDSKGTVSGAMNLSDWAGSFLCFEATTLTGRRRASLSRSGTSGVAGLLRRHESLRGSLPSRENRHESIATSRSLK